MPPARGQRGGQGAEGRTEGSLRQIGVRDVPLEELDLLVVPVPVLELGNAHTRQVAAEEVQVAVVGHVAQHVAGAAAGDHHVPVQGDAVPDRVSEVVIAIVPLKRLVLAGVAQVPELDAAILRVIRHRVIKLRLSPLYYSQLVWIELDRGHLTWSKVL